MAEANDVKSGTTAPAKRRRWPKILGLSAGALVLLLIAVYFVATSAAFLQGFILPRVGKSLNATVTVSDAAIHPFKEVILKDLKVQTTGDAPLVTVKEIHARYNLRAILGGNLVVEEVTVSSPTVSLVVNPDGTSNLDPITKGQKGKENEKNSPPATKGEKTSAPPQIDLKHFALTDLTFRQVKNYAGGKHDTVEVSKLNVTLDGVKNGQTGKLTMSADVMADNNPPSAVGTNGMMQASLKGDFDFSLTPDLKPGSVKGGLHLGVARAEAGLSDLAGLGVDLNCEMSPAEIKQLALSFLKDKAKLGEVSVSGPFDATKMEARLAVQVRSIDRQALNLAGAAQGVDFGTTTINSTNQIVLAQGGKAISVVGELILAQMQMIKAGKPTPTVNLQADYQVALDTAQQSVSVTGTTLGFKVDLAPPVEGKLQVDLGFKDKVADLRQIVLALAPTDRAKNQFALSGRVDVSKADAIQGNLTLASDAVDLTGIYDGLAKGGAKPAAQAGASAPTAAGGGASASASAKEPDPQVLPLKDFTVAVDFKHIYLHEVDVSGLQIQTKVAGSHVSVTPCKLDLNGAPVSASVDLDLSVPGYKYALTFDAKGIPLPPLVNTFQPERKGQISGTSTDSAQISGQGITPASLQQHLAGKFDVGMTNLNLRLGDVKSPLLKTLLGVVVTIPDLIKNPASAVTSLVGSLTDKLSGTQGGGANELSVTPLDTILVRGSVGAGKVNLENALIQSPAFLAGAKGSIGLADPLTNSTVQIPVSISLPRAMASSLHLGSGDNNSAYVKLPDFLSLGGTLGVPKTDINKTALFTAAAKGVVNGVPGIGEKAGGLLQGVGSLVQGGTNSPVTKSNLVPSLLDGLLGPKKK